MQQFDGEIAELRALGFAESLLIHAADPAGAAARLESGRVGVAVEFAAEGRSPCYAVRPLVPRGGQDESIATDVWSDVVRNIRRRVPLDDDD
ncbi:MAG TPA: hypothetical protein VIO33_11850 [Burkholderiaceae bacterium]